jgi:4-hydroxy-tetrahydrodipicolinate reductase
MTITVAVVGATGRMGRLVCGIVEDTDGFDLVAQLGSRDDLAAVRGAALVVDVTLPTVSPTVVDAALEAGANVLVGTSGWSADRLASLEAALVRHPEVGVLVVPNFSIGSVLATSFAAMAARFYESIEVIEAHHAGKIDSPSGTAVRTAELMAAARGELGPVAAPHADQPARGQQVAGIPVHSLRMNGVVARQDVLFGAPGEVLTITHETLAPSAYEAGIRLALPAAAHARGLTVGLDAALGLPGATP